MINTHIIYVLGRAEINEQISVTLSLMRKCLASTQRAEESAFPLSNQIKQGIRIFL